MKIDHLVVNVDADVQSDPTRIQAIRDSGLPYEPKWGKGTRGFKVSNLWIGGEYLEMVHIKRPDGGGWVADWTKRYLEGHRGVVGFALDVPDLDAVYERLSGKGIEISRPQPLAFRWFFNLLTRTMPWRNAYVKPFEGVPFQFFFQQMNDDKSRAFMEQYMVPNSKDAGITGMVAVDIYGKWSTRDMEMVKTIFEECRQIEQKGILEIELSGKSGQWIRFVPAHDYRIEISLTTENKQHENMRVSLPNLTLNIQSRSKKEIVNPLLKEKA
ncbi:VOC family protein [Saccharibacillus sacchari]|uniref:VOC family protein n=1 Tax=Saccharibacillus sacchari TaxID=456493 RepID=UPI0004B10FFF|nr:VOC family protein [Saccharibacillus sacchari]